MGVRGMIGTGSDAHWRGADMRYGMGLLVLLWSTGLFAAGPNAVRKQIQASVLVTGSVVIEADGRALGLEIDARDALPEGVAELIEEAGTTWVFEPVVVDGTPRKAKARMSVRVVATRLDDGNYQASIRSAYFGSDAATPAEYQARPDAIKPIKKPVPDYPTEALSSGARGTVYVAVKIGRQGSVEDLVAEQVNLRSVGNERDMNRMRELLARSATSAIKRWTFRVPTDSDPAPFWTVRVPVLYDIERTQYGQWEVYVPGPQQRMPWYDAQPAATDSPDAMMAGGTYEIGKGLRLLTPLQSG
ncbi:MAG: hypothetical protein DI564_11915 [Rhodanobacter denitrificans]|uniref:Energy transducer TonB n=1 Tax=Rhodanobacter denitrificans TaxID=666685 RepID=A0A2W5M0L5_9GAMM|nr:MAG: hypothetical protein DI564_11915 [Rhodanobacter denitrificans]